MSAMVKQIIHRRKTGWAFFLPRANEQCGYWSTGHTDPTTPPARMSSPPPPTLFYQVSTWFRKNVYGDDAAKPPPTSPLGTDVLLRDDKAYASSECSICTATVSSIRAAKPCGHEACDQCWMQWQRQSAGEFKCMICALPCERVVIRAGRITQSGVLQATDAALEEAVRAVLRVKDDLDKIEEELNQVQAHLGLLLQSAHAGDFDSDSATSIVQVEMLTTHEQIEQLFKVSAALTDVERAVDRALHLLKQLMGFFLAEPSVAKSLWSSVAVQELIESLESKPLASRWNATAETFRMLLQERLDIVRAMASIMPTEGFRLAAFLERIKSTLNRLLPSVRRKIEAFEVEALLACGQLKNISNVV